MTLRTDQTAPLHTQAVVAKDRRRSDAPPKKTFRTAASNAALASAVADRFIACELEGSREIRSKRRAAI
jgi:hypothetical protein